MQRIIVQKAETNGPSAMSANASMRKSLLGSTAMNANGIVQQRSGAKSRNTNHSSDRHRKRNGAVRKCTSPASWLTFASVRLSKIASYSKVGEELRAGRPAIVADILLRLGRDSRRCGVVAKFLHSAPVLGDQPRRRGDLLRRPLQLALDPVDVGKRVPDFFGKGGILLQKIKSLDSHPVEDRLENVEVSREPLARGSEYPHAVLLSPSAFPVKLPKLGFLPRDQNGDWDRAFFGVAHELVEVAFRHNGFVLVIDQHLRLHRGTARVAVRQDEVAVLGQLFAHANARPRPRLRREVHLLQLAHAGDLRHLGFQLLISLSKLLGLPKEVLDPAIEIVLLRLLQAQLLFEFDAHALDLERFPLARHLRGGFQFLDPPTERPNLVPVALLDLSRSLRQFGLEASPCSLVVVGVFLLEQPEGFFGRELSNSGEVLDAEAVENLCPFQLAFAQAKRAFDAFGRHRQLGSPAMPTLLKLCWHPIGA